MLTPPQFRIEFHWVSFHISFVRHGKVCHFRIQWTTTNADHWIASVKFTTPPKVISLDTVFSNSPNTIRATTVTIPSRNLHLSFSFVIFIESRPIEPVHDTKETKATCKSFSLSSNPQDFYHNPMHLIRWITLWKAAMEFNQAPQCHLRFPFTIRFRAYILPLALLSSATVHMGPNKVRASESLNKWNPYFSCGK